MDECLYRQDDYPVFQNRMYATQAEARHCPRGDLRLAEDPATGIVANVAFRPELLVYDEHYQNEQAHSESFRRHLLQVADILDRGLGRQRIVEIGCGKGYFLELLEQRGFDIAGFDPAYEGSHARIRKAPFSPGLLDRPEGLVLRHVLEHLQHPVDFLAEIAAANGGAGRIYIEVPCLDWILARRAWFDVFYEHVNYFRLSDFDRMFGRVIESGRLFGGQYLYVVADLQSLRRPAPVQGRLRWPSDFLASVRAPASAAGPPCAVWGAASKGVIFALLRERAGSPVETIVDINPAKQGQYIAATGLRVTAPEEALERLPPGSAIYVMNSNYQDEIVSMTNNRYRYIGVDHG